ncbi:MAG: MoaD/ThiS family protein [Actinomycetota bacterium]
MQITVQCFGALREHLPADATGNTATVELAVGARVTALVELLGAPRGLVHALLVNEEPSDLDRVLAEGDRVTLMPQFTGGSRS